MSVPENTTVLVIGGGPAGSFAAASLAREGVDVVVIEMDKFPRYHIGESMLPSMKQFLNFIDCYDKFNAHGFRQKNGAAFKLNRSQPAAYTDFLAAGGADGYAWNVIRSEADEILLRHAESCGAKVFESTKIASIEFDDSQASANTDESSAALGRPVSATWTRKDGSTGVIKFKYIVDASGRHGIVSTKYMKNRKFNQSLKNIANWGYWKGAGIYGTGTHKEGAPYFEAIQDGRGWCWFIPLHDGTHSIGIVQNQELATAKKREQGSPSTKEFYMTSLKEVPGIEELLSDAKLISEVKAASDWSYSAPAYASPYIRIAGDAGCFIDPFFSSGVHLALLGGLSAAVTIASSLRGDYDEATAASWHTKKVTESYTRFFLVVSSTLKQIRAQEAPVIQDIDEEGFQRAFDLFRPIIQGTIDAESKHKTSQLDVSQTMEFCFKAFSHIDEDKKQALLEKLKGLNVGKGEDGLSSKELDVVEKELTPEERQVLAVLRSRRLIREDCYGMDSFVDSIDGLMPNLVRGELGLKKAGATLLDKEQMLSPKFLEGKAAGMRDHKNKTVAQKA